MAQQPVLALSGNDSKLVTPYLPPSSKAGLIHLLGSGGITVSYSNANTMTISGSGSGSGVSSLTGNSGGPISPVAGNINIVGSGSTVVAGSGNTLTISSSGSGGLTWNNNATSGASVTNNGYIITAGTAQTFTLPATSAIGNQISFVLNGTGQWRITSNGSLYFAGTTVAAGQFIQSNTASPGASITLVCVVANSGWASLGYTGGVVST